MAVFNKESTKNIISQAGKKAQETIGQAGTEVLRKWTEAASTAGTDAIKKVGNTVGSAGSKTVKAFGSTISFIGENATKAKEDLKNEKEKIKQDGYSEKSSLTTQQLISTISNMPVIRVDREDFLRKQIGNSPYIDDIIAKGPQAVFTVDALRKRADEVIKNSTRKTSVASFAAGFASTPVAMVAAGAADIAQFFGFALNMAQKIAYLFGEDQLFTGFTPADDMLKSDGTVLPEDAQIKMISYLGAMMGVSGASSLIIRTSATAGATIGKKVASQALTKTAWYPLIKKVASILGYKITKKSVEAAISKSVPVVGGVVSGGLTYVTFKPMGGKLADIFVKILNGEYDLEMELNPEYANKQPVSDDELDSTIVEASFTDIEDVDEADVEI